MKAAGKLKQTPPVERPSAAALVKEMVDHFQSTGAYRPEDVRRALGDPLGGVYLTATPTMEFAYRKDRR
jgi:hypothetical protein